MVNVTGLDRRELLRQFVRARPKRLRMKRPFALFFGQFSKTFVHLAARVQRTGFHPTELRERAPMAAR
jgi:hypothetical protein